MLSRSLCACKSAARYDEWRTELLYAMAHVEAFIDFGDDEGIEDDVMQQALLRIVRISIAHPR